MNGHYGGKQMSEFTSGSLVMNKHRKAITEDIIKMTTSVPILYFYNFEDQGWGFTILYQSRVVSAFDYSYEADEIELQNYVKERFPEEESVELLSIRNIVRKTKSRNL